MKENELGGACGTHGRGEKSEQVLVESPWFDHSGDRGVDGGMGPGDWQEGMRSGFIWLRIRTGVGCCEYGDETSGFGAT
jgi:hypothetical protein